ncbi:MAG: S-layer homology domain-containing protein [Clostridia bacterium]|nr:S-layer homology domain-containing protein [Clostridia bacterium]
MAIGSFPSEGLDAKDTQHYRNKITSRMTATASNNNGGEILVNDMSNFKYTDIYGEEWTVPKYLRISANFNSQAQLVLAKAGTLYWGYLFATHLSEVGVKEVTGTDKWLRPMISFWSVSNTSGIDEMMTKYEVYGKTDRRYYWYSKGVYGSNGLVSGAEFGADRNKDQWAGYNNVVEVPLDWGRLAQMDIDFAMRTQWKDEEGSWGQTCSNGTHTAIDVLTLAFARREFETTHYPKNSNSDTNAHGIKIVLYTANDSDEAGSYTAINPSSQLYGTLTPEISIVEGAGGVSMSGNLYVGSKIKIDASKISGFAIPDGGLFITNQRGEKVGVVTRQSADSQIWYVEMFWDGMQRSCLTDTYQLNIILNRTQKLEVDIAPSTPRLEDGVNINTAKYGEVWDSFLGRGPVAQTAALTYSSSVPVPTNGKYFHSDNTTALPLNSCTFTGSNGTYTTNSALFNVQSINFNQDADDVILYNSRAYAGNQDIPILAGDLSAGTLHFTFYDSAYLDAVSPMEVFIDHVEVYYDRNGNGIIDGVWDDEDEVFVLDTDSDKKTIDDFVAIVDGDYSDSFFKAIKDENEVVHQHYFKVYLSMRPRAFKVPAGADVNAKAQLLPAFLSAITDPDQAAELTDEQRSYRYVRSFNADNHPMYGAGATAKTYIDIPLGGDVGEKRMISETVGTMDPEKTKIVDTETETTYTWAPDYTGQLLVPFDNPTPIVDNDNITGGAVSIAGENPGMNADGTYTYSDDGKENVNASLGSFAGRTTFAIGVQEQVKSSTPTRAGNNIDSLDDIKPETIKMGTVGSTPAPDELLGLSSGGDAGGTGGTGPGSDVGNEEFEPDLGVELPSLELELGDYATLIMDGYEVGFAIGIPVYQYEDTSYTGSQKTQTDPDGTVTTTRKDEEGHDIKETVKQEKDKTVKTTVTMDGEPNNDSVKTRVTTIETTDKDGKKTYETTTETIYKKDWDPKNTDPKNKELTLSKKTDTNAPPTEEPEGGFKHGFKEANGGMATLKEFCKALTSPKKGSVKKFMDGAFEDDSLKNAKNGNTTATSVEVSFTVQISIMFEYNPIDNCHYFKSAGLAATLGVEFTVQHRFTPCPIIYVYVKFGIEVEVKVSLSVIREAKEGNEITSFEQGSLSGLSKGKPVVFALDMRKKAVDSETGKPADYNTARGFHLTLTGKVFMEVYDNADCTGKALTSGVLIGDGGQKEVLYKAYNKVVYVKLTPRKGPTVTASELKPVIGATSHVVFDGLTISPGLSLEAGVGVGIELAKFELFVKTSVAISMTMGGYLEDTDQYEGFYISGFEWSLAVGFNATLLFFNYSMDVVAIGVEGAQHGTGGYFDWNISATAANGEKTLWEKQTYTSADGKSLPGEPEPPTGFNIFKDNEGCVFYNADGSVTNTEDKEDVNQDWSFSEGVSAFRWKGGVFKGEIPMNGDLSVARKAGAKVTFSTSEKEIHVYFDGSVKISTGPSDTGKVYTKSPAKLTLNASESNPAQITITAERKSKIDRFEVPKKEEENGGNSSGTTILSARTVPQSLVHVSGPVDVSSTQKIYSPGSETRAIDPTGTADFQLSGYNTSGDARKLAGGLATGYDYKLVEAGGECYIVYQQMLDGAPQLVLSRVVMTGNFTKNSGLVNPVDETAKVKYLVLDNDGTTDLDYSVSAVSGGIRVVWVSEGDTEEDGAYVVKERVVSLAPGATQSEATVLDGSDGYAYLPSGEGTPAVWVSSEGSGDSANAILKKWIIAKNDGITEDELTNITTQNAEYANAVFFWATQSALNDLYGSSTTLKSSGGASATLENEFVENMETVNLGGRTVLLYTTSQIAYFNETNDISVTVGLDDVGSNTERGTIRRLYLRSLDGNGFGPAKLIQTAIDFDGCTEDTIDSVYLKDGLYVKGELVTEDVDPYYSNLRFVTADIDGKGAQTLALFEMSGNTWLLKQAEMEGILAGTGGATLIPIFSEATGTDVCIGSDDYSLAVAYTAPVADSLSNAIYIAWWDKNVGTWGSPTILAMRNLQIYEDRITYDMDGEDSEKAYLGELVTGGHHTGSLDKLTFSNLQIATREVDDEGTPKRQLMILTEGSFVPLKYDTFDFHGARENITTTVPDGVSELSFYAIAFGAGEQAVGEGRLGLANYDFTAGSRIIGEVSFTNTGTSAIRASDANPMTVSLMVNGTDQDVELASWKLTSSLPSGQSMRLAFESAELKANIPAGAAIYLDVAEDPEYFAEGAFHGVIPDLLVVENKPELSFGDFDMTFTGFSEDGTQAIFDLTATVVNNGSATADETFIQFSYDTGIEGELGTSFYPIDITGSKFVTSPQRSRRSVVVTENYSLGVYALRDEGGKTFLEPNCYRTVTAELHVPVSCFVTLKDLSGLHLKAEVYSGADTPDVHYGVYTSDHDEYNSMNNMVEKTFKHSTVFEMPSHINVALGTTLNLPVSFKATSSNPELILSEVSDGTDGWEPRMGICYYDPARQVIVAAPNARAQEMIRNQEVPTGILELKDTSTNTIAAVAYTVSTMADGVNIFRDDATFTFYEPNGNKTDLYAAEASNPGWLFLTKGVELGWEGGDASEIPMNNDLSLCNRDGAYLKFDTVATKIRVYFMGEIEITSTMPGHQSSDKYTSSPVEIDFENDGGLKHTVTIKAKKGTRIDRYVPTYSTDPVVPTDPDSPQIFWNRSFPETASVMNGESVPMTCYVIDGAGLQTVMFNGQILSESTSPKLVKLDEGLWYFDYLFSKNGIYSVRAFDEAGNTSGNMFAVNWFNDVLSVGAIATAPDLKRSDLAFVDGNGSPVATSGTLSSAPWLRSAYTLGANEADSAYIFYDGEMSDAALAKDGDGLWRAVANGCYMVRVDRDDGTWCRAFVKLSNLELTDPAELSPTLSVTDDGEYIGITASDNGELRALTVNGYPIPVSGSLYSGSFPAPLGGRYVISVTDDSGNTVTETVDHEVPVAVGDKFVAEAFSCAGGKSRGTVTVDPSKIRGGAYDTSLSNVANNVYLTAYSVALVGEGEAPADGDFVSAGTAPVVFDSLKEGKYELHVKDSTGKRLAEPLKITVAHPEGTWSEVVYTWNDDYSKVTATRTCTLDETHIETETVSTNFILTKPSTFKEEGAGRYVGTFTNEAFGEAVYEIVIPAVGCDGGPTCPSNVFTDRPAASSFAHIPIDWAVINKVTLGLTPTTFSPDTECTRAQFVTFLWRTMGQPEPTTTANPFKDAKENAFYYKAVLWAVENGITAGTSATTFSPNAKCSRSQVVTFLWRMEGSEEPKSMNNPFSDVRSKAFYFKAVLWAVEKGITNGVTATTFDPNGSCTRAQCVTFLYREFAG